MKFGVCGVVFGVIAIIVALAWVNIAQWALLALGVILVAHSFMCKKCCAACEMPVKAVRKGRK